MSVTVFEIPSLLETYYLDEAKTMATSYWTARDTGAEFLGTQLKRYTGVSVMAGWALPITCNDGNDMAIMVALQHIYNRVQLGRWVPVISDTTESANRKYSLWSYLKSQIGWEAGVVGVVVDGYASEIDETIQKLRGEFSIFATGTNPVHPKHSPDGIVGAPVKVNGVEISAGDLILGDSDGVIRIKKKDIQDAFTRTREEIIDICNILQHVREGKGAVDALELKDRLKGQVEYK